MIVSRRNRITLAGFTIVEMLIVIVVIAILATIVIVAYNGVKGRAIDSMLRSSISSVAQKLEARNANEGAYPDALNEIGVRDSDSVHFQYDGPDGENTYCLSANSLDSSSLAYHTQSGNTTPQTGVCEGHVGPGSGEEAEEVFSFERTAHGDGALGLTIHVDDNWNAVDISWTPQSGAQRYEIQTRNPTGPNNNPTRNFTYRRLADGGSYCTLGLNCTTGTYSHIITPSTTSLVWTDPSFAVPSSAGQMFEYRVRYMLADNSFSEWDTAQLYNPIQSNDDIRAVSNFNVVPNSSYTSATLSWDKIPNFTPKMSEVFYEIQTRNPTGPNNNPTRNFTYRRLADGGSYCTLGLNCTDGVYSHRIPFDTTSYVWTDPSFAVPSSAGQNFEYQIRVRVAGEKTLYSPWSSPFNVSNPIQFDADIPAVSHFTVTPNAGYTNVTLSWDQVPNFTPKMSEVFYEIQTRNPTGPNNNPTRNFTYRRLADGGSYCTLGLNCTDGVYSHRIPFDTTSYVWTDPSFAVPSSAGQNFEYQIRVRVAGEKTLYSPWSQVAVPH